MSDTFPPEQFLWFDDIYVSGNYSRTPWPLEYRIPGGAVLFILAVTLFVVNVKFAQIAYTKSGYGIKFYYTLALILVIFCNISLINNMVVALLMIYGNGRMFTILITILGESADITIAFIRCSVSLHRFICILMPLQAHRIPRVVFKVCIIFFVSLFIIECVIFSLPEGAVLFIPENAHFEMMVTDNQLVHLNDEFNRQTQFILFIFYCGPLFIILPYVAIRRRKVAKDQIKLTLQLSIVVSAVVLGIISWNYLPDEPTDYFFLFVAMVLWPVQCGLDATVYFIFSNARRTEAKPVSSTNVLPVISSIPATPSQQKRQLEEVKPKTRPFTVIK